MELLSIQIGAPEEIRVGERWERTGINKRPVDRARIHELGLVDDHVVDTDHHGGPGLYYGDLDITVERLRRFLASPVGDRNRREYQRQLAELGG